MSFIKIQVVSTQKDIDSIVCIIKGESADCNDLLLLPDNQIRQEFPSLSDKEYIIVINESSKFEGLYKKIHKEQQPKFAGEEPSEVVLWEKVY